jgi:hypothetical protein
LFCEEPVIPYGDFGEAVVGDPKGADVRWGQVIEAQRRHLAPAELVAGQDPAMPGDDVAVRID